MKIAIDMRALPKSGMGNYSQMLLNKLPVAYQDIETVSVSDHMMISRRKFSGILSRMQRLWWEQSVLPKLLKQNHVDLLHNPINFGLPFRQVCKSVVTIHDVIPLAFKEIYLARRIERIYYHMVLQIALRRSAAIITDSIFSRDELIKYLAVPKDKIKVIYLACGEEFKPVITPELQSIPENKFGLRRPYILTIGGNEPRKNVDRLIKLFGRLGERLGMDLVVIGGSWRGKALDQKAQGANHIYYLGTVDQQDLVSLYSMAELFVFPSLYEGFGLPVLEAMACGTPVAASNASSIPEVAGNAAVLFDPLDEEDMFKVILTVLESRETREELSLKGLERAKMFTWQNTLAQTMAVYREVLKS
jgi:glycosyltransferase involved in cell wall biosynthesis